MYQSWRPQTCSSSKGWFYQTKICKAYVLNDGDFAKLLHYNLLYTTHRIGVSANTNMEADEIAFFSVCHYYAYVWDYSFFCTLQATTVKFTYFATCALIVATANLFTKQRMIFEDFEVRFMFSMMVISVNHCTTICITPPPGISVSADTNRAA